MLIKRELTGEETDYLQELANEVVCDKLEWQGQVFIDNEGDISFEGYFSLRVLQIIIGKLQASWPSK